MCTCVCGYVSMFVVGIHGFLDNYLKSLYIPTICVLPPKIKITHYHLIHDTDITLHCTGKLFLCDSQGNDHFQRTKISIQIKNYLTLKHSTVN